MTEAAPFVPEEPTDDIPGVRYYEIPAGTPPAQCRGCHGVIFWTKSPKGKNMPVDRTGRCHFETCPNANDFHKRRPK